MSLPGLFTSDGGAPFSRFKAPVMSGSLLGATDPGTLSLPPGGFMCIQSTAVAATQLIASSGAPATSAYIYIPQGTQAMTSSNTANIAASPPYTGCGAAVYFDITRKKLSVFSTGIGDWVSVTLSSS